MEPTIGLEPMTCRLRNPGGESLWTKPQSFQFVLMPTSICKPLSFCIHQTVIDSGLLDSDQPFSRDEIRSSPLSLWLDSPTLGPEKVK